MKTLGNKTSYWLSHCYCTESPKNSYRVGQLRKNSVISSQRQETLITRAGPTQWRDNYNPMYVKFWNHCSQRRNTGHWRTKLWNHPTMDSGVQLWHMETLEHTKCCMQSSTVIYLHTNFFLPVIDKLEEPKIQLNKAKWIKLWPKHKLR